MTRLLRDSNAWVLLALILALPLFIACGDRTEPGQIVWTQASDDQRGVSVREDSTYSDVTIDHEGYFELVSEQWGRTRSWGLWWDGALLREVQQGAVVRTERCDTLTSVGARVVLDCVEVDATGGGDFAGPIPVQHADVGQLGAQRLVPLEYLSGGTIRHAASPGVVYSRVARAPDGLIQQDSIDQGTTADREDEPQSP